MSRADLEVDPSRDSEIALLRAAKEVHGDTHVKGTRHWCSVASAGTAETPFSLVCIKGNLDEAVGTSTDVDILWCLGSFFGVRARVARVGSKFDADVGNTEHRIRMFVVWSSRPIFKRAKDENTLNLKHLAVCSVGTDGKLTMCILKLADALPAGVVTRIGGRARVPPLVVSGWPQ